MTSHCASTVQMR